MGVLKTGSMCFFAAAFLLAAVLGPPSYGEGDSAAAPVEVKVAFYYSPNETEFPTTKCIANLLRQDPGLSITQWGGLDLPGGGGRAPLMMAIAGKTAPDIMQSWFHIIGNDIRQGFLYPLNEWIGDDTNGNGQIDDSEAKWERWKNIPMLWRQVATRNGKVYGIPEAGRFYMGVIYRMDLVRAAGLNPNKPPETWDELIYWCQKLTNPSKDIPGAVIKSGQRGISLLPYGWTWLPWVNTAGGEPIVQVRKSPRTGIEYVMPRDTLRFVTPEGEDLSKVEPKWRADFTSEAAVSSVEFFHRMMWMKWIIDPLTGEPVNLAPEDISRGFVLADGRRIEVNSESIITGVARAQTGQRGVGMWELLGRGEVAMITWPANDLCGIGNWVGVDPDLLSWFPFPAKSKTEGTRVVMVFNHYAGMVEGVASRPKAERDKVWKVLSAITDKSVTDDTVRNNVLSGLAKFTNPLDLKRLGFSDYLNDIPASIRRNYEEIENGTIPCYTEPYMGFWVTMDHAISSQVLGMLIADTGEFFDYRSALKKVENDANSGMMFEKSGEELDKYRPAARVVFCILAGVMILCVFLLVKSTFSGRKARAVTRQVHSGILPWLIMLPALLLIAVWSYYPLLRGMVMAFQDYRIAGESKFVGLDNFILMALDPSFWASLWRTGLFVLLNMALAFTAPIAIAILLSEIPRGKILFRTLFFLPQVTSGLVIALLWKLMYDPTPQGFFNQLIAILNRLPLVHIDKQTWLLDPKMAMICCVIPTVWATMGMASLIYLAALKGVPEEIYEAADIDGAGSWTKFVTITLPTLLPLIIINFVGAFIGTFQNMGNIFLMTFGGPGDSTMVVGLRIWMEAYNNLRFSMATSMAWVLGSLLIGFTYLQIQMLKRVEFKKATWN